MQQKCYPAPTGNPLPVPSLAPAPAIATPRYGGAVLSVKFRGKNRRGMPGVDRAVKFAGKIGH